VAWTTSRSSVSSVSSKSLEALVRCKVDQGLYSSEEEIVGDALRLIQARDEAAQIKRARLQGAIERGYSDVAASRVTRLENDDRSTPSSLTCGRLDVGDNPRRIIDVSTLSSIAWCWVC